ncbi:MAG: hypothetical protein KDE27_00100, partial [Planctomycetes bacterium]|nr:hypothetical protein [Planctomycetota bacterium]
MSTHDDWVATRFLARLRADEQGGGRRPLREYLAAHPGHEELIAREFVLATAAADELQGELDDAGVDRAAGTIGPFVPIRELGRGSQG